MNGNRGCTLHHYTFDYIEQITLFQHPVNAKMMEPLCNRIKWRWLSLFQNPKCISIQNSNMNATIGSRYFWMIGSDRWFNSNWHLHIVWKDLNGFLKRRFLLILDFICYSLYCIIPFKCSWFVVHLWDALKSTQLTGWFFDNCRKT